MKFSELSNKLTNGLGLYISLIKNNIDNVDSSIRNKEMAFCYELPFAILPFNICLDVRSMNIVSSSKEINE